MQIILHVRAAAPARMRVRQLPVEQSVFTRSVESSLSIPVSDPHTPATDLQVVTHTAVQ